jgi:hypothetical protein
MQMKNDSFNSVIFTDEIEIKENTQNQQGLTVHFNGIYFDLCQAAALKMELEPIVKSLGKKGFHARNVFKINNMDNYPLMRTLTDLIIKHNLLWINFGFPKSWMMDKRLKPFFDLNFKYEFPKNNYKAVGFYFYFHSIHYYQEKLGVFKPKIRI